MLNLVVRILLRVQRREQTLNNWRHHGATGPSLFDGKLDWYSSAVLFAGWKERTTPVIHVPADYEAPVLARARTWLLAEGWKRAAPISVWEVPEKRTRRRVEVPASPLHRPYRAAVQLDAE